MHSSRPSNAASINQSAVRELVARRIGCEWCLFLDRDGVINRRIVGDYVRDWSQFEWLPKAPSALKALRSWAPTLVVVTNQQGVGKGLMTAAAVDAIHHHVEKELAVIDVTVDGFKVCPHLGSAKCDCRKPMPKLVLDWLAAHPHIDPSLSIMVGDSRSDLELARNVAVVTGGCASILVGSETAGGLAVASFTTLGAFADAVVRARGELDC